MRYIPFAQQRQKSEPPSVRIVTLGAAGVGKTCLDAAIAYSLVEGRFPSGGGFRCGPRAAADLLAYTRMITEAARTGPIGDTIAQGEHVYEYTNGSKRMCVGIV